MLIRVKAGEGRRVPMPDGTVIQGEAEAEVLRDLFVGRRLDEGDLVEVPAETPAPVEKKERAK